MKVPRKSTEHVNKEPFFLKVEIYRVSEISTNPKSSFTCYHEFVFGAGHHLWTIIVKPRKYLFI